MFESHSDNIFWNARKRYSEGVPYSWKTFYESKFSLQTLSASDKLIGHGGCVNAISFSSTGDKIITGSDDTAVMIWDTYSRKCLAKYFGHLSNVFATKFFFNSPNVVSGGNDGDMRYYDVVKEQCVVYQHFKRKCLSIEVVRNFPSTFFSCGGDGTIRMIDTRKKYNNTVIEKIQNRMTYDSDDEEEEGNRVIPQAMGGGRVRERRSGPSDKVHDSLLIDFGDDSNSLYNLSFSPNGHDFVVWYDVRKVRNWKDYANIFRNVTVGGECTGCCFKPDGREIVCSMLMDKIYTFDVHTNYCREFGIDYSKMYGESVSSTSTVPRIENNDGLSPCEEQVASVAKNLVEGGFVDDDKMDEDEDISNVEEDDDERMDEGESDSEDTEAVFSLMDLIRGRAPGIVDDDDDDDDDIGGGRKEKLDPSPVNKTFKNCFEGHYSQRTLKVVNTVVSHPTYPMLASSGIDSYVQLWESKGNYPKEEDISKRLERRNKIKDKNKDPPSAFQSLSILDILQFMMQRQGEGDD